MDALASWNTSWPQCSTVSTAWRLVYSVRWMVRASPPRALAMAYAWVGRTYASCVDATRITGTSILFSAGMMLACASAPAHSARRPSSVMGLATAVYRLRASGVPTLVRYSLENR